MSTDGTHLKDRNLTYERAQQLRTQLKQDVKELLQQAEQADQKEEDPQKLPQEIARREKLLEKMEAACAALEARAQARAEVEKAEYERKLAEREQREPSRRGPPLNSPGATNPGPKEQINLTDADARLMCKHQRDSYSQSYNAQVVVDAGGSQLIVGQRVSNCASDGRQLEANLQSIPAALGQPRTVLADCGYLNAELFQRLGEQRPELELYVSVRREDTHAQRRYDYRPLDKINPPRTITDPVLAAMAEKLKTPAGKGMYRKRACTVEPVFGIIKACLGFRQFLLRGLRKVSGEWNLICLAYNLKRLHRLDAEVHLAAGS